MIQIVSFYVRDREIMQYHTRITGCFMDQLLYMYLSNNVIGKKIMNFSGFTFKNT